MSADVPQAPAGLAEGSRIAGYLLEEQIGRGGMAVVFRAFDEKLGRRVALKVLAEALAADPGFRQRFVRESRAAAAVDDPHIIPLYEAGEADGVLFIAMRYVQGGDVRSLLNREGALGADRVATIVSPVASALDAAHAAGLVHRDVKPANMLLDVRRGRPDHVYLSDFGLSKEAALSASLTGTGLFLGTVDYAAPEQIDGRAVDGRTDQYALACAAFEMFSGQPPFRRDQGLAVLHAHLSTPPPKLSMMRPGLPAAADAVFGRALAKSPQDRYPSCGEFSDALRGAFGVAPYYPEAAPAGRPATQLAVNIPDPRAGEPDRPAGWILPGPPIPGPQYQGSGADTAAGWRPGFAGPGPAPGTPAQGTPPWPAQPGPYQQAWTAPVAGQQRAARWPYVLLAAALAAAAAVVAIALVLHAGGTPPRNAASNHSHGVGQSTPATGQSSQSPSVAPTNPGWTQYQDPSGFSVQLPPGWAESSATRTGRYPTVSFAGPDAGFHLVISWSHKTGTQALTAVQSQATHFASVTPSYQLIELQQVTYRTYNSAVWEFSNDISGVRNQDIDFQFVVKPHVEGYAIELWGPQPAWAAVYGSIWNNILATFKPAP